MAVPPFHYFLDPFLRALVDGRPRSMQEMRDEVAVRLGLSAEDRLELVSSGIRPKADDRTGWARTYLGKAGLVASPRRGYWQITEAGKKLADEIAGQITLADLRRFPSFIEFAETSGTATDGATPAVGHDATRTPREDLDAAYDVLRGTLEGELLDQIKAQSPAFFERLVIAVLQKMGYGGGVSTAGRVVGKSGDGGIDGLIDEDRLGLDQIYVQAKRWENGVGGGVLREFLGALTQKHATKGVIITTSYFTPEAMKVVTESRLRIIPIDGQKLVRLMTDYDVGVTTEVTLKVQKLDGDYFTEE